MPKLHILVDSREASVSLAKDFFSHSKENFELGQVEHIREKTIKYHLNILLATAGTGDKILVSVSFIDHVYLEQLTPLIASKNEIDIEITLASYSCFDHIEKWCEKNKVHFLENFFQKRANPKCLRRPTKREKHQLCCISSELMLERIWVQYRLMLAIISRIHALGTVCRLLILGLPDKDCSLADEHARAIRYFTLGEPDMAGGSYSCENNTPRNPIDELRLRVNKIAATDFNVLLAGESGSGKETVAWSIHELSRRRDNPFLAINCAGLPDELLESEMFGYVKGSHNQADHDRIGFLESVDGGTLFLDELPDMSQRIQAKLLRFLESGEFRPVGSTKNRYADVRIVAAGQPLLLKDKQRLRPDLKSRISQLSANLLSLRELEQKSPGTTKKIAFILLERYTWTENFHDSQKCQLTPFDIKAFQQKILEDQNIDALLKQEWRESNVRELNNFLRSWMVFGDRELAPLRETNIALPESSHPLYDDQLQSFLVHPQDRNELKTILEKKPFQKIKEAYVRHLYEAYRQIVETENNDLDTPRKATQKEFAQLMGVTENTISRCLN